jgi:hypothetical protein
MSAPPDVIGILKPKLEELLFSEERLRASSFAENFLHIVVF